MPKATMKDLEISAVWVRKTAKSYTIEGAKGRACVMLTGRPYVTVWARKGREIASEPVVKARMFASATEARRFAAESVVILADWIQREIDSKPAKPAKPATKRHYLADDIDAFEKQVQSRKDGDATTFWGAKGISKVVGKTVYFYEADAQVGDKPETTGTYHNRMEARYYALANAVNGGW